MKPEKLTEIITGGEGLTVEFKQSRNKLNRDVFETVWTEHKGTEVLCTLKQVPLDGVRHDQ